MELRGPLQRPCIGAHGGYLGGMEVDLEVYTDVLRLAMSGAPTKALKGNPIAGVMLREAAIVNSIIILSS